MPTPSLLIVPARFKTGKLYSQIPTSGAGDFTVTRNTAARRFNSAGLIESVASGIPRLDYYTSGGVTGCPALLVEPAATNLCPRSQEIDLWSATNASATLNVAISPDGTQNAELFVPASGTTGRAEISVGTLTNATTYTLSFFMKQDTNSLNKIWIYVSDGGSGTGTHRWGVEINIVSGFVLSNYTASNGSVTSSSVENYGNGWRRIRVTGQVTSGITSTSVVVIRELTADASTNGTNGVLVWGAQLETGSVATSYIPTTTGTGSRSADVVSVSGAVSGSIGQTEGTIYWEGAINRYDRVFFALSSGTSTTQAVRLQTTGAGLLQGIAISGTVQGNPQTSGAVTLGQFYKVAFAYKENDFVLYVNGVLQASDPSGALPTNLNSVYFCNSNGTEITDQRCRAAALYTTRLTNAELATLTTP